jgi:hypothetical protein
MWDFGPDFFEWWASLTPLVRYGVAVVLLLAEGNSGRLAPRK